MFLHDGQKNLCLVHMKAPPRFYYWETTHLLGHHSSGRLAEYESLFLSEIIQFLIRYLFEKRESMAFVDLL